MNIYIFIIWNRVLWCKKKIINDLKQDFDIVVEKEMHWRNKNYERNFEAFYGDKLTTGDFKSKHCKRGRFSLIIIRDNNPQYDYVDTSSGRELVNKNVFAKKELYRQWSGGGHRIHCSNTTQETIHDLTVLFGNDYKAVLYNKEFKLKMDTKGVEGFKTVEELVLSLNNLGDNIVYLINDKIIIWTKSRVNIIRYILPGANIYENKHLMDIGLKKYNLYIMGEREGDIPYMLVESVKEDEAIIRNVVDNIETYTFQLSRGELTYSDYFPEMAYSQRKNISDILPIYPPLSIVVKFKLELHYFKCKFLTILRGLINVKC